MVVTWWSTNLALKKKAAAAEALRKEALALAAVALVAAAVEAVAVQAVAALRKAAAEAMAVAAVATVVAMAAVLAAAVDIEIIINPHKVLLILSLAMSPGFFFLRNVFCTETEKFIPMFFPIGDDNRDRVLTPYINYTFILINILVFIFLQDLGRNIHFTFAYSTIPAEILSGKDLITSAQIVRDPITGQRIEMPGLQPTNIPVYLTLITSLFMHGGVAHIAGNMLYLWIFGDNLENVMGHRKYFIFYLLCGVLASLAHVFTSVYRGQNGMIPSLGASGAISGVLGGYLLLFPTRRVRIWILLGSVGVPAFLVVGLWFLFQLVSGLGLLGGEDVSGIAYAAHIGGFIAGFILVKMFTNKVVPLPQKRKSLW